MVDREDVVRQFFKAMEDPDPRQAARSGASFIAEGAKFYEQVGVPPVVGPADCEARWSVLLAQLKDLRSEILHIASSGDTVFVERVDSYVWTDERRAFEQVGEKGAREQLSVVGVGEVNDDGKITEWRDYFATPDQLITDSAPESTNTVE